MPRFDGTGPMGMGPMTGRGMGPCAGYRCPGCGYGIGYGRGRYVSAKNELSALENEEKAIKGDLEEVQEEITAVRERVK